MIADLLNKYNIAAPRYTSYPTVPYWQKEKPSEAAWLDRVKVAFDKNKEISLYIHLPYCESLCTYCGCNKRITKNHAVELPYINAVINEWKLYLTALPEKPIIKELHFGGGTPTFFSPGNLAYLLEGIFSLAEVAENHAFSFEAHPFSTTVEHLEALKAYGFNRISMGVQDFDEKILKAINRNQTIEQVENITKQARKMGYESVNFDLIFGLPFQTKSNIIQNMQKVEELLPERIAFYSYAHVPWIYPGQRAYAESDLPKGEEKRALYELGKKLLLELGYEEIGFDHFALPTDELSITFKEGKLNRNFMGYTPFNTQLNLALGVSAISDSWTAFAQNEKKIETYMDRVNAGELPFFRGHLLNKEDQILRRHILNLICRFETSWEEDSMECEGLYAALERMEEFEKDKMIKLSTFKLEVTAIGKPFIRNICLALDTHYWAKQPEGALFSQVV
jgi:oxygen-independent coproporphyrinogen-3 oxidase